MASMLRQSWQRTLRDNQSNFQNIQDWMNESKTTDFFTEIRHLFMMLIVPKQIHRQDQKQTAYLKAAVARVIFKLIFLLTLKWKAFHILYHCIHHIHMYINFHLSWFTRVVSIMPEFSYSDQFRKFLFLAMGGIWTLILTKLNLNLKHISIIPLVSLTGK